MRTIGIAAHSSEGAGLCFLTACRVGGEKLGEHRHPPIVMSALPMSLSMPGWNSGDWSLVEPHLVEGVRILARAGADFFVCPDNTAHLVLDRCIDRLPLPGLHIAEVVCAEIRRRRFSRVGLLGTRWTMEGEVYARALTEYSIERLVPDAAEQALLHRLIFDELCNGHFGESAVTPFLNAIDRLRARGAQAVILGCTEIPIVVSDDNASLPTLDSTRLLARDAVALAMSDDALPSPGGWVRLPR